MLSSQEKYRTEEEFNLKVKQCSQTKFRTDDDFPSKVKQYSQKKYKCDPVFQSRIKQQSVQTYVDKKNLKLSMDFVIESFRKNVKTGPRFDVSSSAFSKTSC